MTEEAAVQAPVEAPLSVALTRREFLYYLWGRWPFSRPPPLEPQFGLFCRGSVKVNLVERSLSQSPNYRHPILRQRNLPKAASGL